MRTASYQQSSYLHQVSFRRRASGLLLAILANALILFMLLRLAPFPSKPPIPSKPVTVELLPNPQVESTRSRTPSKTKRSSGGAPRRADAPPAPVPAPPIAPPQTPPTTPLNMLIVSKDVFAASDISKLPTHHADRLAGGSADGAGSGEGSGADDGPGTGPGGERLYNADWYQRPTPAQLDFYRPKGTARFGWGIIACRTIERYQVDDCAVVAESPPGSGFARSIQQAAWQFRVMPPRVGGRPLVGTWVRIRIDFLEGGTTIK